MFQEREKNMEGSSEKGGCRKLAPVSGFGSCFQTCRFSWYGGTYFDHGTSKAGGCLTFKASLVYLGSPRPGRMS